MKIDWILNFVLDDLLISKVLTFSSDDFWNTVMPMLLAILFPLKSLFPSKVSLLKSTLLIARFIFLPFPISGGKCIPEWTLFGFLTTFLISVFTLINLSYIMHSSDVGRLPSSFLLLVSFSNFMANPIVKMVSLVL